MKTPKTPVSQTVIVTRKAQGGYDWDAQWEEPGSEETIATITDANIIPRSGTERVTNVETVYESDYQLIAGKFNVQFEDGYSEIKRGDKIVDVYGREFQVVFPGFFQVAHVMELKELFD